MGNHSKLAVTVCMVMVKFSAHFFSSAVAVCGNHGNIGTLGIPGDGI